MVKIKPSKHDSGAKIQAVYEAADWLHNLGLLVPCTVFFDGRLTRSGGNYGCLDNMVKIAADIRSLENIQSVAVHEFIHAYQHTQGYLNAEKYVNSIHTMSGRDKYLMQRIEREAYWWQNEYMKDVHGREIPHVRDYQRLGVVEFL